MTQQEVIKTFMESLNNTTLKGGAALDEAIKASSKFKSFKALRKKFLADLKAAKNYQTFLIEKCGIILDNADTGAISGSDAGGSKVKTANDILTETGEAKYPEDSEGNSLTSFTVDGLTIYGIPPKEELTADQQYVVQGLYSWWIRDALALIKESYGFSFSDKNTTGARLKLVFMDNEEIDGIAVIEPVNEDEKTSVAAILGVNMAHFKNMSYDDRHGAVKIKGKDIFLDRTLIHELVHGIMASNVNYFGDLPMFLIEGGSAELIHGIDDKRKDEIIEYVQKPDVFEEILTTTFTLNDSSDDEEEDDSDAAYAIYAGGYTFMRYFAKQAATDTTFDYDVYHKNLSTKDGFAVNYHDTVTITGGKSNDTIINSGSDVSIKTGSGKDNIKSYSDKVTISAGNGADYVSSEGEKVSISAGAGNDSILNQANNTTIAGGDGKDTIANKAENVSIDGGTGKDSISNISEKVTINGDAGNDSIENLGSNVMISGGEGNDSINNYGSNTSVSGDSGNDSIANFSKNVTVHGGADNDFILNSGSDSKIYGGAGNDFILNGVEEGTASIGFGNLLTLNSASKITLKGGDGDDSIKNIFEKVKIYGGNDNDSIYNEGKEVSIYGGAGMDFVENHGDSVAVSLGTGNDSLKNYSNSISVDGGAGKDTFINVGAEEVLIMGGTGNDSVYDYGLNNTLLGGKGNDYIYSGGLSSTLNGEDGNDSIKNEGMKSYVLGGADNDTIRNEGDRVTISGGAGNDSIRNKGGKYIVYEFGAGDGKDTVTGFNANDTIKITSGKYSAEASGKNVVVTVGEATLTLKNATGKQINFVSASGKETSKTYSASAKKSSAKVSAKVSPLWFADDDNFTTSDNLSSLVKGKEISASYSELDSSTSLTKKNNLVTFSGNKK